MTSNAELGYNLGEIFTENFDDLIFVLNQNFECEFVNEKIRVKKLGYFKIKDPITTIFHHDDISLGKLFLQNVLKYGQAIESLRVRQDKDNRYYEFKGKSFKNEKQEDKLLLIARDISVFKLKYTDLIENIEEAYFEVDLKGTFMLINNSFSKLSGYTKDETIGKNYKLLMDDENKSKVFKVFNAVYKSGLPHVAFQFEFLDKENKKIIVETSIYLNRDTSGKKIGFYGNARDITQKFKLEQKLKQSEEKYRHLFENSPYVIWIADLNGKVLDCNAATDVMLSKYSREDLIGKNFVEILGMFERPEYFIPFFKSKFASFVKDEPLKPVEFKMTRNDGVVKWINLTSSKIKLAEDTLIQVLIQDVTEKKNADLKLQKSEEELKILNKELERIVSERTKELRESEEKFRTIAENSLMGIAIIQDNKIKYVNQLSSKLTGYTVDETKDLSPTKIFDFVHPKDRLRVLEQLQKKQTGAKDYVTNYQYRIIDRSGNIRWLDNYSKTIDYMGKPADFIAVVDITERKNAEQKLKESEEMFRTIAEHSEMGITIIQDGKINYANEAMSNINGFTLKEMMDMTSIDLINQVYYEDREYAQNILKGRLSGDPNLPLTSSYRINTKNGDIKSLESYSKTVTYQDKLADLALIMDVTEKNLAQEKLRDSEEKYRHLYENSPFSIVLLDYEGKILDMNTKTTEFFGYGKEDLIGKNYLKLTGIYPDDTKTDLRMIPELIAKELPPRQIMKPQIIKIYNKDMNSLWVDSELSSIKLGDEVVIQAIIQDVTEKKIAEEKLIESERKLRQQNIELKELDRLKTDFISIAAHDLKTPLISVGGYIDLILLREKDLSEEVNEDLGRVLSNVQRLEEYINRLLDVMKIDAKKVELVKKEENIYELIKNCISDLEFQISQKNLTINLDISEDLKLVIDHFRISQVFLNLLSNAVKFTPNEGDINISIKQDNEGLIFCIKDNGKGLTPEEIQKIFGKFVTIEQGVDGYSTLEKGSGLGLYIAKGFIEAHGGKIWVKSEGRDLGAEFSFTLPKT